MFGRRKPARKPPPPPCPECGKPTNLNGRFCRACGWDADLAESEDAHLDGVSVPEVMDDDGYADFLAEQAMAAPRLRGRRLLWTVVAIVLVLALAWTSVLW